MVKVYLKWEFRPFYRRLNLFVPVNFRECWMLLGRFVFWMNPIRWAVVEEGPNYRVTDYHLTANDAFVAGLELLKRKG